MTNFITILSFLFFLAMLTRATPPTRSSNETDLLSLLAFKDAVNDPLGALKSWNETTQLCSWNGIRCGRKHPNRVVGIDLSSQSLVGWLSPSLGNISFLRRINLQNNGFHGQIPRELSLLKRLEFVEFSNNSFGGQMPRNMSQCKNLVYLNLVDNNISGTIPDELGSLCKLEFLFLSDNPFSGHIPPSIGNLTSLRELGSSYCALEGEIPESFAKLQRLEFLSLGLNHLTGSIPLGLCNISTLRKFELSYNRLQGTIPSTIGLTLANLKTLLLAENQFTGVVPVSLSNATSLQDIELNSNHFTGPLPRVGKLSSLVSFISGRNLIRDDTSFISEMTNCTNLQRVQIAEKYFSGSFPNSISNLSSHLEFFEIFGTEVHGNIPSGIGNLVGLETLSLGANNLEGPIPSSIGKLSNLKGLYLGQNRLTNELPSSLGNLTYLNKVELQINNFFGTIPRSLGNCTNLIELYLSFNNLSGPIPREIMSLSSISIALDLSDNGFTDSVPSEIGSLTNLAFLDLSDNRLIGPIPNSISSCTSLVRLYLECNLLEGQIPPGLRALKGLQDLDLSGNNLSGSIPSFICEFQLDRLNISFNRFQGEVPTSGVFRNKSAVSLEGNKGLCGGIHDLNLPPCTLSNSSRKLLPTSLKILIPIGVVLLFCLVVFLYKKRIPKKNLSPSPSFIGNLFLRLSYSDLLKATDGFSMTHLVGAGRFGSVYKGFLNDGQTLVAVKVLNLLVQGATRSFMAECSALKGARHKNLVKLLSVCDSIDFQGNDFKALVYEYKSNGSLEKWLHNNWESEDQNDAQYGNLSMIHRLNIAIDIAHALEYLHCSTDSTIVHGDLKPSNILLGHDMIAHVGDFGLAKIVSSTISTSESTGSKGIKGTIGYVAPEYGTSNSVSTAGDVYSYGILLLEIFTNRRPTHDSLMDHMNLHNFVTAALADRIEEIVDPLIFTGCDLNNTKAKNCMTHILGIGVACSNEMPGDRMTMADVVNELHKIKDYYLSGE